MRGAAKPLVLFPQVPQHPGFPRLTFPAPLRNKALPCLGPLYPPAQVSLGLRGKVKDSVGQWTVRGSLVLG